MTESYFLFNAGSIALGLLVAMMFWYIFEAIRKWANKEDKEKSPPDADRRYLELLEMHKNANDVSKNWNFEKPTPSKVSSVSYNSLRESNHLPPMPKLRKVNYYSYHPYNYENYHNPKKHQQMYFLTRQEAEKVLDRMHEILNEYGTVTVGDLYDITGERADFSDMKYGWRELPIGGSIVRDYKGYTIDFPTPIHLD